MADKAEVKLMRHIVRKTDLVNNLTNGTVNFTTRFGMNVAYTTDMKMAKAMLNVEVFNQADPSTFKMTLNTEAFYQLSGISVDVSALSEQNKVELQDACYLAGFDSLNKMAAQMMELAGLPGFKLQKRVPSSNAKITLN